MQTVTAIKKLQKRTDLYAVFIDGSFYCSLPADVLSARKIAVGSTLSRGDCELLLQQSNLGKVYSRALNYLALRPRSEYEMRVYLHRKNVPDKDIKSVIDKLYGYNYLDDQAFASAWVRSRQLLKKRSNAVLRLELKQKGISDVIIATVLEGAESEANVLRELIHKKRRIARYKDNKLLEQYLLRQGFRYSLIKEVLAGEE